MSKPVRQNFMKLKTTMLALFSLLATSLAGDAEMKQQLVGTWNMGGGETAVLNSDGTRVYQGHDFPSGKPFRLTGRWDVKNNNFIEIRNPPEVDRDYTIISITKHEFKLKDNAHGRHTGNWIR
jgi:hypothetical protein